jgi:cellulose synthase/poly-beta-1,6-N-acetylglucosamine synthase-like glycosyltransferase
LKIIPYFSDPSVGGVGGIPLPKDPSHIIAKMRSLEVYYNIGFLRLGQRAVDAVTVIPGIMSAYRRNLVSELGGFTEGLNGEDTDITVRVGRMGYRIIVDPAIEVYSEVPKTLAHLREQRLRWSRSYIHVFARNKSAIGMLQGIRGLWVLPLGYIATFRRTLVVPILVYALIVALFNPTEIYLRQGASIVAVIIGSTFFLIIMVLLMYRRIDLIPYIPSYLALRLIRAYVSLEMLFTLPLKDSARK